MVYQHDWRYDFKIQTMTWCSPWISGNVNKYSYIQRWVSLYHEGCKSSLGRLEIALLVLLKPHNLRSGSIFVSLCKYHSGGHGETKREPDTNLWRGILDKN